MSDEKMMPVDRDYDFDKLVPDDVESYREHNKEFSKILSDIEQRQDTGKLPRYIIGGPTGAGKTHLARAIASELDVPLIEIQGKYSMNESDLLGSPILLDDETVWTDGPLTRALIASQEEEVVLLIDEVNRARPESKSVLFSALDDRARVELDGRGGEVIEGDAQNLIVIGTVNEGPGYYVEDMDHAERRRFGTRFEVDHLGMNEREEEIKLLTERTPAHDKIAEKMVDAANKVRNMARNPEKEQRVGVPTATLMNWSRTSYAYEESDVSNPVVEAAKDTIVKPLYDQGSDEVLGVIKDYLQGAVFNEEEFEEWEEEAEPTTSASKYDDTIRATVMSAKDELSPEEIAKAIETDISPSEVKEIVEEEQ